MLLRRVIEHVKSQNWFAVGLDFLIVVVGVFMGLQVQVWNENRQARIEERRYLEQLVVEFDVSLGETADYIETLISSGNMTTIVISSLDRCALDPRQEDEFASGIFLVGRVGAFLSRLAPNGLEPNGAWHELHSVELRHEISNLIKLIEQTINVDDRIMRRMLPHIAYIESQTGLLLDEPHDGVAPIAAEDLEFDIEGLCRDTRFKRAMLASRSYLNDEIYRFGQVIDRMKQVRELIVLELED